MDLAKLVTGREMTEIDRRTIAEAGIPGVELMERAGAEVVAAIAARWARITGNRPPAPAGSAWGWGLPLRPRKHRCCWGTRSSTHPSPIRPRRPKIHPRALNISFACLPER